MKTNFTFLTAGKIVFIAAFLFLGINCFSQQYSYDANGNLSRDTNKQIRIHYNYLNLADTIIFEDGREIVYAYTSSGRKLTIRSIAAHGGIGRKADYVNSFLYENDTLRHVSNKMGRSVPVVPGSSSNAWEYQYDQIDQTGDVRNLVTSRQDVETSTATFEMANSSAERNQLLRYDDIRTINSTLLDHTNNGTTHFAERLNGSANEKYGVAKSLSVMPGDVINLEVFAKYIDQDASHWTVALNTLINQIATGSSPAGMVVDGSGYSTSGSIAFPFAGLSGTSDSRGAGPKAYLNWLLFDRNFVFKNGGYLRMSASAKENGTGVPHERLSKQLTIREPGYVYVYLSNEETTPVDVFFDDLRVELVNGPVIQQTDYDPFGLAFNEAERENIAPNDFLYNGKELQRDFGLDWYDYGARMYDPALGRWHAIDPATEKYANWSPYNYVLNSPVAYMDPDGESPVVVITNTVVGEASMGVLGSSRTDNGPRANVTVPLYLAKAYDPQDKSFHEEFAVTRDSWVVHRIMTINGNREARIINVAFEPPSDTDNEYDGAYLDSYPHGNDTPGYALMSNGKKSLRSAPKMNTDDEVVTTVTDIIMHVGGFYHNETDDPGNKVQGATRAAASLGCFGIVNTGNSKDNPSDKKAKEIITAIQKQEKKSAAKGQGAWTKIIIQKRKPGDIKNNELITLPN